MTLKTSEYFPIQFKYVAVFLLIMSVPLIIEGGLRLVGVILLLVCVTVLTVRYEFEIDKETKQCREYVRLLWMKLGKMESYNAINYCYLTASKYTEKMQLKAANTTAVGREFNGYIKFDDESKSHVLVDRKKERIDKKLKALADYLEVKVIDYTEG